MRLYKVIEIVEVSEAKESNYSSKWVIDEMRPTSTFIEVGDDPKELCKKLKELGLIDSADQRRVSVSSMSNNLIEVRTKKDFKPLCRLEAATWVVR